ncbi:MAG: sigma-70 family RNA polymerase sigma factor [Pirellulaceae bacterium]
MNENANSTDSSRQSPEAFEQRIFENYVERLLRFAKSRLPQNLNARVDPDDIVQSVFRTFFRRYDQEILSSNESLELWRLLASIAYRKVLKTIERHQREKRNVVYEARNSETNFSHAEDLTDVRPDPAQVNMMVDELRVLLEHLPPTGQQIVLLRMDGHELQEIATKLSISLRSVNRILKRAKEIAVQRLDDC